MSTTLNRSISYGMVLGLGIVALAVLLFAARPGTNDEAATAPGLGVAPRYAVLGEVAAPQGDIPVTCPSKEFVADASGQNTTPKPSPTPESTPVPATWLRPPPCVHALAWVAAPSAPVSFPNTGGRPQQGGVPWIPLLLGLALSSLGATGFVLSRRGQHPGAQQAGR